MSANVLLVVACGRNRMKDVVQSSNPDIYMKRGYQSAFNKKNWLIALYFDFYSLVEKSASFGVIPTQSWLAVLN